MLTGPEFLRSRALLRRSDAEPAAWLELFFCEGTRAAPSVTRASRMGFCFELEPIRRARPWRHREERPGSCLFLGPEPRPSAPFVAYLLSFSRSLAAICLALRIRSFWRPARNWASSCQNAGAFLHSGQ